MLLYEILEKIDENSNVNVILDDEIVSRYDGKNSIDEQYDYYTVDKIRYGNDGIDIELVE